MIGAVLAVAAIFLGAAVALGGFWYVLRVGRGPGYDSLAGALGAVGCGVLGPALIVGGLQALL